MPTKQLNLPIPLDELKSILRSHGVIKASVFGSYAKGSAGVGSDLDLLVELEAGRDYLDLGGLQYELQEKTGRNIDITTKLNKHFAPYIEPDLIDIL